jgi:cyclopropane-fatty-acyl-phospholipid synthase
MISPTIPTGFLSDDMTYSCAIFNELDSDVKDDPYFCKWNGGKSLKQIQNGDTKRTGDTSRTSVHSHTDTDSHHEDTNGDMNGRPNGNGTMNGHACSGMDELFGAQMRKLDHIIRKAKIQEGHRVLEIGSGWGSMAIRIAQRIPGTTIDTITLSAQQRSLAQQKIAAAGLSHRIRVHLMDYRSMPPEWEGAFDRLISIEMLEAVGSEFFETYWKIVDWALKPRTGAGVVQVITIPEASAS